MRRGKMDRAITIQALTTTQDGWGEEIQSWASITPNPIAAQYLPGGGNERFAAGQIYAQTEARFHIYWRADVTPLHRVIYEGREYDILSADEIGRREGLELKVKARAV